MRAAAAGAASSHSSGAFAKKARTRNIGCSTPWREPDTASPASLHHTVAGGHDRRRCAPAKRREAPQDIPDVVRIVVGEAAYGYALCPAICGRDGFTRDFGCGRYEN